MARLRLVLLLVAAALLAGGRSLSAADPAPSQPITWLTGDKLRTALEQNVGVTWAGISLRRALTSLSQSQRVGIVIDRRVDPDQKIELSFEDVPLDIALKRIAQRAKIGVAQVGSVFYFGPETSAQRIRTLSVLARDEALKLPAAVRLRLLQTHPWHWDDAAEPRELVAALAEQAELKIESLDRIPHDLWGGNDLPPLSFGDRLTLIAAQYDSSFHYADDGAGVKLVDMPERVELIHAYGIPSDPEQTRVILKKLGEMLPDARFEIVDKKLVVRGRAEDQEFVANFFAGKPAKKITVSAGTKVYTLSIVMQVGKLLEKLGPGLDIEVRYDMAGIEAAGLSLKTEVKVDVKQASADELLAAVLTPAGMTFDRKGRIITVRPKK